MKFTDRQKNSVAKLMMLMYDYENDRFAIKSNKGNWTKANFNDILHAINITAGEFGYKGVYDTRSNDAERRMYQTLSSVKFDYDVHTAQLKLRSITTVCKYFTEFVALKNAQIVKPKLTKKLQEQDLTYYAPEAALLSAATIELPAQA